MIHFVSFVSPRCAYFWFSWISLGRQLNDFNQFKVELFVLDWIKFLAHQSINLYVTNVGDCYENCRLFINHASEP